MACDAPLSIKYDPPLNDGRGGWIYYFPADCGKCLPCLLKRKAQWSYRMVEEMRNSNSAYFVTLTYEDWALPHGDWKATGNKNDHKLFIKWLKYYEDPKRLDKRTYISPDELRRPIRQKKLLKYYGVLEYGDLRSRPHFHYILFNIQDVDSITSAWCTQTKIGKGKYKPDRLRGRVQVDECNINTIDYVLKYMVKDRQNQDPDLEKERSWMSKGIGDHVDDEFKKYINKDQGNLVLSQRSKRVPLPRYYRKKYIKPERVDAKNRYIAEQVEAQKNKSEARLRAEGLNPDKVKVDGIENRVNQLKYRKLRNHD